jgi:oxygen-independent coproporphyrinogen-3 oxidase
LQNTIPAEEEVLTVTQQLNEYIMTSLRTIEGLDLNVVERKFGSGSKTHLLKELTKWLDTGKTQMMHEQISLTQQGKLFADAIAADLFFNEDK